MLAEQSSAIKRYMHSWKADFKVVSYIYFCLQSKAFHLTEELVMVSYFSINVSFIKNHHSSNKCWETKFPISDKKW